MDGGCQILYFDDLCALGAVGNVFISLTRRRQDVRRLRQVRVGLDAHFKRWPGGVGTLSVLEANSYSGMVTAEEREEIQRMAKDYSARGVALVIEGSGFRPAAMRTLLAGVYLVTRVTYPRKIFSSVGEAASWISSSASAGVPGAIDTAALVAAVEKVRAAIAK